MDIVNTTLATAGDHLIVLVMNNPVVAAIVISTLLLMTVFSVRSSSGGNNFHVSEVVHHSEMVLSPITFQEKVAL